MLLRCCAGTETCTTANLLVCVYNPAVTHTCGHVNCYKMFARVLCVHLALGEHLVGAPVGGSTTARRVVLVQLAATQSHGCVCVGISIDVVDQYVALFATVVACICKCTCIQG